MAKAELRTERLLLRSFEASDVDDVLAYATDQEFRRFLAHLPEGYGRGDAEAFVARNISESWENRRTFALVLGDTVIGALSFDVDAPKRSAMLGYAMGRPWWGQGLVSRPLAWPLTGRYTPTA